ncbi:MAG: C39 family peptidase [bacterium]|nr:C39 family peptidase [bacterium]
MMWKVALAVVAVLFAGTGYAVWNWAGTEDDKLEALGETPLASADETEEIEPNTPARVSTPTAKTIEGLAHVWQSFNNCSSVALLIVLSHWGIADTQERIAEATRPWNNRKGDNDDKSVTLHELADYAREEHGLLTYVRPNGDIELLKKFIANDIPVLTRALTYADKDYVHYRIVRGYDESKKVIIESDGIEGPNEIYTYDEWLHLWKDFNYSYLIIVPPSKKKLAESLLGESLDEKTAWNNAKMRAESELAKNPSDYRAHYNLITALYYLDDYAGTVREFEKTAKSLTAHKLWYQMEPIEAYYKLGKYDRVIELADSVINANNKSVSELYVLKGNIYKSRGDTNSARAEYEKALYYNKNLQSAKDALASLGG